MSQNMQSYPRTGIGLLPNAGEEDPMAQADTLKIICCPICRATYIPSSQAQMGTQNSATLLETAFLEVCHFCFRCQRPACPQCWNPVHHVCTSCSAEEHLPFRSPVPSLEGLVFSARTSSQAGQQAKVAFTCLRNGRFYTPELASPTPSPRETGADPVTSGALPTIRTEHAEPAEHQSSYPIWLQEITGPKPGEQTANQSLPGKGQPLNQPGLPAGGPANGQSLNPPGNAVPWNGQAAPVVTQPQMVQTNWPHVVPTAPWPQPPLPPAPLAMEHENAPAMQQEAPGSEEISPLERVENILIVVTSVLLLAVVLMIVLALSSADINSFLFHIIRIDIRTEIAYLLQLR